MIKYTAVVTKAIEEKDFFENVKDFLFNEYVDEDGDVVEDLPKDVQRLLFAKVGAMMIDFAKSENFNN